MFVTVIYTIDIHMDILISNIIQSITDSFDFVYCVIVNVGTYVAIKSLTERKANHKVPTWHKRAILLLVSIVIGVIYYATGSDTKTLFNSFVLAPVSWSWIFKPICDKLGYGYDSKVDAHIGL